MGNPHDGFLPFSWTEIVLLPSCVRRSFIPFIVCELDSALDWLHISHFFVFAKEFSQFFFRSILSRFKTEEVFHTYSFELLDFISDYPWLRFGQRTGISIDTRSTCTCLFLKWVPAWMWCIVQFLNLNKDFASFMAKLSSTYCVLSCHFSACFHLLFCFFSSVKYCLKTSLCISICWHVRIRECHRTLLLGGD